MSTHVPVQLDHSQLWHRSRWSSLRRWDAQNACHENPGLWPLDHLPRSPASSTGGEASTAEKKAEMDWWWLMDIVVLQRLCPESGWIYYEYLFLESNPLSGQLRSSCDSDPSAANPGGVPPPSGSLGLTLRLPGLLQKPHVSLEQLRRCRGPLWSENGIWLVNSLANFVEWKHTRSSQTTVSIGLIRFIRHCRAT